jgi:hypothetical protein
MCSAITTGSRTPMTSSSAHRWATAFGCATAAQRTLSVQARAAHRDGRAADLSAALRTLGRHSASADPLSRDVRIARDTLLDVVHTIGVSSICRVNADTLTLGADADTLPWATTMPRAVSADDMLRIWHDTRQEWVQRGIRVVGSASGSCGDSTTSWSGSATQRLVLTDTISGLRPGAPVRVLQREKWSLVRGGDGLWALSMATWNSATGAFTTPQPLIAPLASPGAAGGPGFAVRAIDARGLTVADSALTRARSLIAVVRAARQAMYGVVTDSVRINVGAH